MIKADANRVVYRNGTPAHIADVIGPKAKAWRIAMPDPDKRARPDWSGCVDLWIIRAPEAHPAWSFYMLSVIHLRPIEGVKPATITLEGATHELVIASIDPGSELADLAKLGTGEESARWLTPIDHVVQFKVRNDSDASQLAGAAVYAICMGNLSPDQDYRSAWRHAIAETAMHIREGRHPEPRA